MPAHTYPVTNDVRGYDCTVAQYQITSWRTIPSMVVARDDAGTVKISLAARFQEAIDEAAMQAGAADSDAYLDGWVRSEWQETDGNATEVAESIARDLEEKLDESALADLIEKERA